MSFLLKTLARGNSFGGLALRVRVVAVVAGARAFSLQSGGLACSFTRLVLYLLSRGGCGRSVDSDEITALEQPYNGRKAARLRHASNTRNGGTPAASLSLSLSLSPRSLPLSLPRSLSLPLFLPLAQSDKALRVERFLVARGGSLRPSHLSRSVRSPPLIVWLPRRTRALPTAVAIEAVRSLHRTAATHLSRSWRCQLRPVACVWFHINGRRTRIRADELSDIVLSLLNGPVIPTSSVTVP